jgi:hypothetical protein
MSIYRECPICGANLDPGERCDCRDAKAPAHIITMEDWQEAGDFGSIAKPGDAVDERIVDEFLNCVPPRTMRANLVQCGEPYGHREDPRTGGWRPTFITFERRLGQWYYRGHCFSGEVSEPKNPAGATA